MLARLLGQLGAARTWRLLAVHVGTQQAEEGLPSVRRLPMLENFGDPADMEHASYASSCTALSQASWSLEVWWQQSR